MKYFQTKHQKKSAALTSVLMMFLFVVMYVFGMQYLDPPEEYGIAINFGTSDYGSGPVKKQESVKSTPKVESVPEQKSTPENTSQPQEIKEEVLTQKDVEAPVIKKEIKKAPVPDSSKKEKTPEPEKEKVIEKPKPSKATQNALSNLLNGAKSDGEGAASEGDDNTAGVKGKNTGDPTSSKYYGTGGSGGDGNYNLSGRNPISKPVVKPNCNEEGTVVVRIEVDKSGKVIKAIPGVKGTTNSAPCLLTPAKEAAMQTKWNADNEAPHKQVGRIIYKFSLSE